MNNADHCSSFPCAHRAGWALQEAEWSRKKASESLVENDAIPKRESSAYDGFPEMGPNASLHRDGFTGPADQTCTLDETLGK